MQIEPTTPAPRPTTRLPDSKTVVKRQGFPKHLADYSKEANHHEHPRGLWR